MIDSLLLMSGNDIPFVEIAGVMHNPTLKEIAYIGEDNFFTGFKMLTISKNLLPEQDRNVLGDLSNFDILIAMLKEHNAVMQKSKNCVNMTLAILFPMYTITFTDKAIILLEEKNKTEHVIDKKIFDVFQSMLKQIFYFGNDQDQEEFNPDGELSAKIADKLRKRHQKIAESKNETDKPIDILSRYVSILSMGTLLPINLILQYTVYQLFDQIKRYELKVMYDINVESRLAGAQDIKDPEDWMKSIH